MRPKAILCGVFFLGCALAGVTSSSGVAPAALAVPRYSAAHLPNVNESCSIDELKRGRPRKPLPAAFPEENVASAGAAIGAGGQVAGTSYYCVDDGSYEAVSWKKDSLLELNPVWALVYPVGWEQSAFGINSHGTIVGAGSISGFSGRHAFVYRSRSMIDLGTLYAPGRCDAEQEACSESLSIATAVNERDQVVGASDWSPDVPGQHAFLFSGGSLRDLGTLGGPTSWGSGLNNSGDVVGFADTLAGESHAFLLSSNAMQDLGTLGGADSAATSINNGGEIVGYSDTAAGARHAFVRDRLLRDLGTLGGSTSAATAVSDHGVIVGEATVPGDSEMHAFVISNGVMRDLNNLVPRGTPTLECAAAVSGSGQIVANTEPCPLGQSFANVTPFEQAYLLTPGLGK